MLRSGKSSEAYIHLHRAAKDGLVDEWNLLDLAVAAARTNRPGEARDALIRAKAVLPLWKDRLSGVTMEVESKVLDGQKRKIAFSPALYIGPRINLVFFT